MTARAEPVSDAALEQAAQWAFQLEATPDDARLRTRIDAWVAASEENARAWALACKTWTVTGHTQRLAPAPPASPGRPARIGPSLGRRFALAAAAVLAVLMLTPAAEWAWLGLTASHATATAQAREIALEDSSSVHLAPDSAISTAFSAQSRKVTLLRGGAFFKVASDPNRPFSVAADAVTVTVTGTAFEVGVTQSTLSVAVASGSVRVQTGDAERRRLLDLGPGQAVTVDRRSGEVTSGKIPAASVAMWRGARLVADNMLLADAAEIIGRYHRGIIYISDARLGHSRVTGVFDLHDPVRALRTLAASQGGTVRQITPFLILVSAAD